KLAVAINSVVSKTVKNNRKAMGTRRTFKRTLSFILYILHCNQQRKEKLSIVSSSLLSNL
ncbi:hypothetical protein MXE29_05175, partial [Acinetobacter baumannii]